MAPDAQGRTCSECGYTETWQGLAQRELADWLGEPTLADEPDDVGVYHRVRGRDDDG